MLLYLYQAQFNLTNCVNDIDAARAYLERDDMTPYLVEWMENRPIVSGYASKVEQIRFVLEDEDSGTIDVTTSSVFPDDVLEGISYWISGQASDGLGEGFEQQVFAAPSPDDAPYSVR